MIFFQISFSVQVSVDPKEHFRPLKQKSIFYQKWQKTVGYSLAIQKVKHFFWTILCFTWHFVLIRPYISEKLAPSDVWNQRYAHFTCQRRGGCGLKPNLVYQEFSWTWLNHASFRSIGMPLWEDRAFQKILLYISLSNFHSKNDFFSNYIFCSGVSGPKATS
jgi:hypothetical protein